MDCKVGATTVMVVDAVAAGEALLALIVTVLGVGMLLGGV
jgi:hypothetical protein